MKIRLTHFLSVLIGALFLMSDAFFNKFPLVYSDTSTYIASGFDLETPFDRPITYGLFVRFFSFNGWSMWLVIFFQALILSFVLFQLIKLIIGDRKFLLVGLTTILFLSLFTGVSWTVSQVMPDIFTSIAIISIVLIVYGNLHRKKLILMYSIFLVSAAMHMSHILLFGLLLVLLFLTRKYMLPKIQYPKRNAHIITLFVLTLASIVTMGAAIAKSKHVFFMGAMAEHGILKAYLDDNCGQKNYKLCAYKDSLPERAYDFVWLESSPFYKVGGWKETKGEFNEIIYATLTQPKYIGLHIKGSVRATFDQLHLYKIGDGNGVFLKGTLLHERITAHFKNDLKSYEASKQNQSQLAYIGWRNDLNTAILASSIIFLAYMLLFSRETFSGKPGFITVILLFSILLNAWDCGTFANAIDRLGCKMIWLIPLLACLFFHRFLVKKREYLMTKGQINSIKRSH